MFVVYNGLSLHLESTTVHTASDLVRKFTLSQGNLVEMMTKGNGTMGPKTKVKKELDLQKNV